MDMLSSIWVDIIIINKYDAIKSINVQCIEFIWGIKEYTNS